MPESSSDQPPSPPDVPAAIRIGWSNAAGITILTLIVLLAVCGVFGRTDAQAAAAGDSLQIHVIYPARMRYTTVGTIELRITNRSAQAIPAVRVAFEPDGKVAIVPRQPQHHLPEEQNAPA